MDIAELHDHPFASLLMHMILVGLDVEESNLALLILKVRPVRILHGCPVDQILDR